MVLSRRRAARPLAQVVISVWLLCRVAGSVQAATCTEIGADARQRLVSFVVKKYKLPPQLAIHLEESGFVGDSCYRKVRFFSVASARFFDLSAILAPDQLFLVTGVDDTRIDPVLAAKKLEAAREEELLRGNPPVAGPANARSTIVVFSDFECPFCKGAVPVLKDALNLETHDVRVIFRNYPLEMHPWALRAALSAKCAFDQSPGAFWKIHDFFFDKQSEITLENIDAKARGFLAEISGLDLARHGACVSDEATRRAVQADIDLGNSSGVDGTPSIYVNGRKFTGALTTDRLRGFISAVNRDGAEDSSSSTRAGSN
jgi:protein-disulfide isomerase